MPNPTEDDIVDLIEAAYADEGMELDDALRLQLRDKFWMVLARIFVQVGWLDGGYIPSDLLGSGTADATTVLHGDRVWRVPAGGEGGGGDADTLDTLDSTDFALAAHNHAGVYSPVGHNHAGVYVPVGAWTSSALTGTASWLAAFDGSGNPTAVNPATFAAAGHNHSGTYAPVGAWSGSGITGPANQFAGWDGSGNPVAVAGTSSVEVAAEGVLVGTRPRINLIAGTGVTLTVTDDAVNGRVDIEIEATGGGGGTFPGVYGFDLSGASTSAGYTSNRTTAGSYASYTATAILLVPIEVLTVVWDAFPGTWDLSINGVSYGTQVSAGSPATLTWTLPAGTRFLTSVAFTFTRSAGTSQVRDASSQTKYLAHWIWAKDAEYGGSTFTFTPAISMTYVPATLAELV